SKGKTLQLTYKMEVKAHPDYKLSGMLTSNKTTKEYENRTVTFTTAVTKGYGEYEYKYSEVYEGKTKVLQEYGSKNTYSFTTAGIGTHTYYVDIRDRSGQTLRLSYVMNVVKEPITDLAATLSSNKSALEYVDRSVVLTAAVTKGNGGYQYQFSEEYEGEKKIVQEYSSSNKYSFATSKIGEHIYYVDIKDSKGKTLQLTYKMEVKAHPDYKLSGTLTSNKTQEEYVARSVVLTAKIENIGYGGEYLYQFSEVYNGITTVLQEFSESPTYSFTTQKIGTHVYYVTIKDRQNQTYAVSYSMQVKTHPDYVMKAYLTCNGSNIQNSDVELMLTASVEGGYGGYAYQFSREYNGFTKILQEYSEESTYSFTTGLAGDYTYYVEVQDASGAVVKVAYDMKVESDKTVLTGIDVSAWQGKIDWSQVKQAGIDFAMLRILSGGMNNLKVDSTFYYNIKNATAAGIPVGVYRYGYAMTVEQAQKEAQMVVDTLKTSGCTVALPVAYDVEDADTQGTLSRAELTAIIKAFQKVIEDNGYRFMIYASKSWLETTIDMSEFSNVDVWVARWFNDGTPNHDHGYTGAGVVTLWQYTDKGTVPGITGNVDMNIGYEIY
ncbi:GH25 family lysozyme, partial [Faecalicatena contorta]|uniref:GH25 family lysozyme n=1 Tax=Faecalicatena contorta TaxID=39482 RepID=UPI002285E612